MRSSRVKSPGPADCRRPVHASRACSSVIFVLTTAIRIELEDSLTTAQYRSRLIAVSYRPPRSRSMSARDAASLRAPATCASRIYRCSSARELHDRAGPLA